MSEPKSHKALKNKAAGQSGETEKELPSGKRLDAKTPGGRATEIERSGQTKQLESAAERLKESRANQRVLQVPNSDIPKAVEAMKKVGVGGTVKNLSGTNRRYVPKQ